MTTGTRGETLEKPSTTLSRKRQKVAGRRAKVAKILRKRDRDGNPVFSSTRCGRRRRRWSSNDPRSQRTLTAGAKYLVRPKAADITSAHKEKRCSARTGPLLSKDPTKITFVDDVIFSFPGRAFVVWGAKNSVFWRSFGPAFQTAQCRQKWTARCVTKR